MDEFSSANYDLADDRPPWITTPYEEASDSPINYDILPIIANYNGILLIIIVIIAIIILMVAEYTAHDCIPGKSCTHKVNPPADNADNLSYIDGIQQMVKGNYTLVIWRQSVLVALLITPLLIYYLKGRFPTTWELLLVGFAVFLGSYFSYSWIYAHFYRPNDEAIEQALMQLRDKLNN